MFGLGSGSFQPPSPVHTNKPQTHKVIVNNASFKFLTTSQSSDSTTTPNSNKNPKSLSPQKQFFIKSFCVNPSLKKNHSDHTNQSTRFTSSTQNFAKLPNINDTSILNQGRNANNLSKSEILSTEESSKHSKNNNQGSNGSPNIAIHSDYSIKLKPLEKFSPGSITQIISSDLHYANFFMDNAKKYKILKQGKYQSVKTFPCNGQSAIDQIKQGAKLQGLRRIYPTSKSNEGVKGLEEICLVKKKGQTLTEKEERQVKLLRKKVEITSVLNSRKLLTKRRKHIIDS